MDSRTFRNIYIFQFVCEHPQYLIVLLISYVREKKTRKRWKSVHVHREYIFLLPIPKRVANLHIISTVSIKFYYFFLGISALQGVIFRHQKKKKLLFLQRSNKVFWKSIFGVLKEIGKEEWMKTICMTCSRIYQLSSNKSFCNWWKGFEIKVKLKYL